MLLMVICLIYGIGTTCQVFAYRIFVKILQSGNYSFHFIHEEPEPQRVSDLTKATQVGSGRV